MEIQLKGMAWDHPRGYEPLRALSCRFMESNPGINIKWDIRSLKEFGDMPIEDLIEEYDLITIDHPYMGQAHKNKLLLDLNGMITNQRLTKLEIAFVDHCFGSYKYEDHLYALPIDAAALVAAKRDDLILELRLETPRTHEELKRFYRKVPKAFSVAWALCPTDMWCSFLTLCAQEGGRDFIQDYGIIKGIGIRVIDQLKLHLGFLHPDSINWNPIQVLDQMAENRGIVYSPYLFGYTNYSRKGFAKNRVSFLDSPINPKNSISTILGGVGLAISTTCQHKEMAVELLNYIADPDIQAGYYVQHQGQPAGLLAWQSEANDTLCGDFFKNTMTTMRNAYVRPRHPGWNEFQKLGADLIHEGIVKNSDAEVLVKDLNALYKSIVFNE